MIWGQKSLFSAIPPLRNFSVTGVFETFPYWIRMISHSFLWLSFCWILLLMFLQKLQSDFPVVGVLKDWNWVRICRWSITGDQMCQHPEGESQIFHRFLSIYFINMGYNNIHVYIHICKQMDWKSLKESLICQFGHKSSCGRQCMVDITILRILFPEF